MISPPSSQSQYFDFYIGGSREIDYYKVFLFCLFELSHEAPRVIIFLYLDFSYPRDSSNKLKC